MPSFLDNVDFGQVGGAISDLFGSAGDKAEASAYGKAAQYSLLDAAITKESTALTQYQQQRQAFQNFGTQQATAAGNGLTGGGSAADILRSSHSQSALSQQLIGEQGQINEASYQSAAASYTGMQKASKSASTGGFLSGLLKVGTAVLPFL